MKIVFDMDNTVSDEFGSELREGIKELLSKLVSEKHTLVLWTNSSEERAEEILTRLKIKKFFSKCIFREDYDPENAGKRKDIRSINADLIIDDDEKEIFFNKENGKKGFRISPFRKGKKPDKTELEKLYGFIRENSFFFGRLF
ncbi:MAG TPA: HAD family hydrolase [Leptospiraceae bacterium]|nr:HAD family hydrolase [Leptospiraceae bacterium]HMY66550.1 HAD family hydrolase [Leptospiraceae bacterium]HNF12967.1 HAD family hydrolase [Leptospiraceae bacterium]HNF26370.1 HAD family hydrolase [Leptospiraceae bacterium]HNI99143.1 HAD family hydrolase [Leptospiraceae bacterium]